MHKKDFRRSRRKGHLGRCQCRCAEGDKEEHHTESGGREGVLGTASEDWWSRRWEGNVGVEAGSRQMINAIFLAAF